MKSDEVPSAETSIEAIKAEILAASRGRHDSEDMQNFYYVEGTALDKNKIPKYVKKALKKGQYNGVGLMPENFDTGHEGWTLDKFVKEARKYYQVPYPQNLDSTP